MKDFNSDEHVEEWMAENGGVDGLRRALARGSFGGQNRTLASAWLQLHDHKHQEQSAQAERSLLERSVAASERSARSAQQAARWAIWAAVIALAAIIVSTAQYLKGP